MATSSTTNDLITIAMNKASDMDKVITPIMQNAVESAIISHNPDIPTPVIRLVGLDARLKGRGSFESKSQLRLPKDVNDALRYTFIVNDNSFMQDVADIKRYLQIRLFDVNNCKNFFCPVTNMYRGLNCTFKYKDYTFEVQFHTEKTFDIKTKAHVLYEKVRTLDDTGSNHGIKCDLAKQMRAMYNGVTATGDGSVCKENTVYNCPMGGRRKRSTRRKRSKRRRTKINKRRY